MASERERWIGHLELFLHARNKPTEALDLPQALRILQSKGIAGTTKAIVRDERWIIQLAAVNIDSRKKIAVLLFLGIDKERAQAVYGDIETLNLRTARKKPSEGGAVSAHLVINTATNEVGRHKAVLEEIEGLSRSRVVPFLRSLLYDHVRFLETKPNNEKVSTDTNLTSDIILDKPISQQLNEGRLLAVDLYRKTSRGHVDAPEEYSERLRLLQFVPTDTSRGTKARRIVASILGREKSSEYPEVRIRMEEDRGLQRTVQVNRVKSPDVLKGAFQRRTLIDDIKPPLPEATRLILTGLVDRMAATLKAV